MIVTRMRPVRDRWDAGWNEYDRMRRDVLRWADAMNRGFFGEPGFRIFPLVNVSQDDENFYVRAELPGVKASDLQLSATGRKLSIAGKRELPEESAKVSYHRKEREGGSFSRSIELTSDFDRDKIDARYQNGILTVTLPRSQSTKPRQIPVKTS
ncbi:MAG: Hsp20/alpha crystallin family protein [Gemmatimonadota bacterium]|nr:MAG: Hsp20/alpha crystallin family protein [Gemmatimonadota bacterium]